MKQAFLDTLVNKDEFADAESIMKTIDKDKSGAIEFQEFFSWYMEALGGGDDGGSEGAAEH